MKKLMVGVSLDLAGADGLAQRGWNNVQVRDCVFRNLTNDEGEKSSVEVALEKSAQYEGCESWGFGGGDERLHRGGVKDSAIAIRHVPFKAYDVIVHLGAGVNGWRGDVMLVKGDGTELGAKAVNFGWIGNGRYVEATRDKGTDSDKADCYVVFRNVTGKAVAVRLAKRGGQGSATVVGVQVVPR